MQSPIWIIALVSIVLLWNWMNTRWAILSRKRISELEMQDQNKSAEIMELRRQVADLEANPFIILGRKKAS